MSVTEALAFGGGTETLVYDGLGQRVQKILPSGTTVYAYDAFGQLTAEYSTVANTPQCTTCYLSYDYLGSVRLVTDSANNVISRHDYLPFGEEIPGGYAGRGAQWGAPDGLTQRFTGQIRDSETGQDFFNARYFTGALGRFNSPDPFPGSMDLTNPQTFNRYAYALNNPLVFIDPFGLDVCEDEDDGGDSSSCSNTPDSSGTYHCTVFLSCGDLPPIAQQVPPDQIIDIPSTPETGINSGEPDPSTYDVPLNDLGAGVINLLGQNAAAQQRFIGKFAATSVATGASIALAPMLGSALNRLAFGPGTGRLFYSGWSTVESTLSRVTPGLGRILPQSPMGSWYMRTFGPGGAGQPLVNLGWRGLSWAWAAGAAGTVRAFTPGVVNSASYWVTTEFPTLMRNPTVFTPIIYPWLLP